MKSVLNTWNLVHDIKSPRGSYVTYIKLLHQKCTVKLNCIMLIKRTRQFFFELHAHRIFYDVRLFRLNIFKQVHANCLNCIIMILY